MHETDPTPFGTRSKLLNRYAAEVQQIREGGDPFPVGMEINVSNFCSQACSWCISGNLHDRHAFLDIESAGFRAFLSDFKAFGGQYVTWSGGGEPTEHPKFEVALSLVSDIGLPQGLMTHGAFRTSLVPSIAKNCAWTRVSLDTHDRIAYAERRRTRPEKHDRVLENVRAIVACGGTVGLNMNVGEWNKSHIEEVLKVAADLGVKYLQIRPILPTPHHDRTADDFLRFSSANDVLLSARSLRNCVNTNFTVVISEDKFADIGDSATGRGYSGCNAHRLLVVLNFNGDLVTCMYHLFESSFVLGNIYCDRLEQIWASAKRKSTLILCSRLHTTDFNDESSRCQICCKGHEINKTLMNVFTLASSKFSDDPIFI